MPALEHYASMTNTQLNEAIDAKLKSYGMHTNGERWTNDLNLIYELIEGMRFDFDLFHQYGSEWIGVAGTLMRYKSFDLCRVLCVLWLAQSDVSDISVPTHPKEGEIF